MSFFAKHKERFALAQEACAKRHCWSPYPDMPDKYPHRKAMMPLKSNYMMMIDNLMDLTHLGYVHTKTIGGNPKAHVAAEMETVRTETGCKYIRWMLDAVPPPTFYRSRESDVQNSPSQPEPWLQSFRGAFD